jgi:hypothetical protein
MTISAWVDAAKKTDRRPVLLMSVESPNAISRAITTKTDWDASSIKTNVNTASVLDDPGVVIMTTDGTEEHSGVYPLPVTTTSHRLLPETIPDGGGGFVVTWAIPIIISDLPGRVVSAVFNIIADTVNATLTQIRTYTIEGSLGGGAWEILQTFVLDGTVISNSVGTSDGYFRISFDIPMTRGNWRFRLNCSDMSAGVSAAIGSYLLRYETWYVPTAVIHTKSVDLGAIPVEPSVFGVDDVTFAAAALTYTARGSNDGSGWSDLGPVTDGATMAPYRFYDFTASFTSSGPATPVLREITVVGGNSQYERYSTHEDIPIAGARPLLINSLGSLGSKIELMKLGSTGEVSPKLFYRRETFEMLRDNKLRNKYVSLKYGFLGLAESDFQPIFSGLWYDGSIDLYGGMITAKTRSILARYQKAKMPKEMTPNGETRTDSTVPPIEWVNVNIITAILDIIDYLGTPGRWVDTAAASTIRSGVRNSTDWNVSRRLDKDNKEDALKLLEELSVLAGLWIIQKTDGVLTFKVYDPSEAISGEIDTDHASFSHIELGQADLYTRQQIYYEPRHIDDLEIGVARGAWASDTDYSRNDSVTVSGVTWYCLQSHQSNSATSPGIGAGYRAFWATEWVNATAYVIGDVRLGGGPLYTCKASHTSGPSTKPGVGTDWRTCWVCQPIKSSNSAENFHSSYVLINQDAETAWGLNKDVPSSDPDYQANPGYQKQWFDKWCASSAAIAALAARMDGWFATPKMKLKASDLPPQYFDQDRYQVGNFIGVTGLVLPVAGAEWGDHTDKKKFLIMSNTFDPAKCTVSFDLLEV